MLNNEKASLESNDANGMQISKPLMNWQTPELKSLKVNVDTAVNGSNPALT